ncbi:hypothetical protein ABFS83_09G028700 [Erythranthe nasuta]
MDDSAFHVSPSSSSSSAAVPSDVEYLDIQAASESSGNSSGSQGSVDSLEVGIGSPMSVGSIPSYRGTPDHTHDGPNFPPANPVEADGFNWTRCLKLIGAIVVVCAFVLLIALIFTKTRKKEDPMPRTDEDCEIRISVSKNGKSDYRTISEAVDASPSHSPFRICILIGAGEYDEKVVVGRFKSNLTLIGEGSEKTTITSNSTPPLKVIGVTATLSIAGTAFMARDLTVSNSAELGVAVESWSDRSVFFRVILRGVNKTLTAWGGNQFYRSCLFYGKSYLVVGNADAFFQKCDFYSEISHSDETAVFLGQSRNSLNSRSGFLIHQCGFYSTGVPTDRSKVFLGSALGDYALIVVMQSYLDAPVARYFENTPPLIDSSFVTFGNSGRGSTIERESSVVHPLGLEAAEARYSLRTFVGGVNWIPDDVDHDMDLAR